MVMKVAFGDQYFFLASRPDAYQTFYLREDCGAVGIGILEYLWDGMPKRWPPNFIGNFWRNTRDSVRGVQVELGGPTVMVALVTILTRSP